MNLADKFTTAPAADDRCHGLRCFHGKKGGQQALFEIFTGAPPTLEAFGIFCMK